VTILVLPEVHMLDLAGPLQVFDAARELGLPYRTRLCGPAPKVRSAQGLWLADLDPLAPASPGDLVVVPGVRFDSLAALDPAVGPWLRAGVAASARICSICTGAFVLAQAGLLHRRQCTTRWRALDMMSELFPAVTVVRDEHVVEDGRVLTSAGISAGIDLALRVVAR
jgi:transcriptional regulator GlxA family with amidase domain